jgi:hypothetical protein
MGADEVFVHLGPAPTPSQARVEQAIGVALDDGVIAARPDDPGNDDLSTLLAPEIEPVIEQRIEAQAPSTIPEDWVWNPNNLSAVKAGGTLHSIDTVVRNFALDVEMFNETEGRVKVTFEGAARPRATIEPRSIALVSYFSGECEIDSSVSFQARASFTIDLSDDLTQPLIDIGFIDLTGTVGFVEATGTVWAFHGPFPWPRDCDSIEGDIEDGLVEQVDEKLSSIENDDELKTQIQDELSKMLEAGDLANGPLSSADLSLPNGIGFTLGSARYVPTALSPHVGGDVHITTEGIDLAAGVLVDDQGGQRFGYSYVPSGGSSLVGATYSRSRPSGSGPFDLGVVLSGAAVNQLGRALSAGKPQTVGGQTRDVGLLDMTTKVDVDGSGPGTLEVDVDVHPSVPLMYLPHPPSGWPADGDVDLYVPSLRISIPHPELATMVADVRVGATASIDPATDHLVPSVQTSHVAARFLRLGPQINQVTDPASSPGGLLAGAANRIQQAVPEKVAELLAPVAIPDLADGLGAQLHLENLSVGTVGGSHLGAYVDVVTGGPPPTMATTWSPAGSGAPTSFTTALQLPPSTGYRLDWTVADLNGDQSVLYRSPAGGETASTKTFPVTGLDVIDDVCTGEHWVRVRVTVVVTRVSTTRTETMTSVKHWPGTPPTDPPPACEPDPEPEPEPEDPPIPPVCIRKPWLCEEEP